MSNHIWVSEKSWTSSKNQQKLVNIWIKDESLYLIVWLNTHYSDVCRQSRNTESKSKYFLFLYNLKKMALGLCVCVCVCVHLTMGGKIWVQG